MKNARECYNDAVSEYNSASSRHSEAERRKNEAQSRVKQSKDIKDKLIKKEEFLQAELDCLTDFLQRLKQADLEVNRTWKMSEVSTGYFTMTTDSASHLVSIWSINYNLHLCCLIDTIEIQKPFSLGLLNDF